MGHGYNSKYVRSVCWHIVANLNLNQRRNFKSHLHYDITLKFKTESKYENDFYCYFYLVFHLLR